MYVKIGRKLVGLAEVTEDRYREPVLILKRGVTVDYELAKALDEQLADFITYETAYARWCAAPLTYQQAGTALGVSWRSLSRQVQVNPAFPHHKIGCKVVFFGSDVEEIRHLGARGERHATADGMRPGRREYQR